ncbi:MAG: error-prone DNA polymerase [Planctomycetota bacterium]|nr:error-prone DNA polymerase [Planctomycetota bacterium]
MPQQPEDKFVRHPWQRRHEQSAGRKGDEQVEQVEQAERMTLSGSESCGFVDLVTASNFSFLRGASHPEELVATAAQLGARAISITDRHTVSGIVRAHLAAQEAGIHLVPGARIELWHDRSVGTRYLDWESKRPLDPPSRRVEIAVHAVDLDGWRTLCRLLTIGKRRAPKGRCLLTVHDLLEHHDGIMITILPVTPIDRFLIEVLEGFVNLTDLVRRDAVSLGIQRLGDPDEEIRLERTADLGRRLGIPMLAQNDVHYHEASRREVQDVLTCIRHGCTLDQAGRRLWPNDQRRLRPAERMRRRFSDHPEALVRSLELTERSRECRLDRLRYEYPAEITPSGATPISHLRILVEQGATRHFGPVIPETVRTQLDHELQLIDELDYARYFLTVDDLVRFARGRGILCQGRGAAANSAVCYCLGITAVDPTRIDMLFERFISRERDEPPDIDVDFEHERREEVIQYIYGRYGRDRAALIAEVVTYRGRSAIREVGTALGLSKDLVDRLASDTDWWSDGVIDSDRVRALGLDPDDHTIARLFVISESILGFPRHLSQHVGGFVITDGPLWNMVPVENAAMPDRTVIEWDKDDVDAMGMLKIDCLSLGMLSCIRRTMDLVNMDRSDRPGPDRLELHSIPAEDPAVYAMFSRADTVGVFQIESRAQMSMLPRLKPKCFYDLVIEVAIVRPGPIQGDMVHPYLRRRDGEEIPTYPDPAVRRILEKTLGVPLFQEQAMSLAVVAAGFTPGEADELRRAIAAWKRKGNAIMAFGERLQEGMAARGYDPIFAEQVFTQIRGFSGYGFPESHAASFALLVYASGWLKCREPAAFAAALINSQPMGFYAPAQIIRDALEHGVEVRRIDVQESDWDCHLERTAAMPWDRFTPMESNRSAAGGTAIPPKPSVAKDQPAIRLGLRLVRGLPQADARSLMETVRRHGRFETLEALANASGLSTSSLRRLARADAFRSLGITRQQALWKLQRWRDDDLPLFGELEARDPVTVSRGSQSPGDVIRIAGGGIEEPSAILPKVEPLTSIASDYESIGLSLGRHPIACLRSELARQGVRSASELADEKTCPDRCRLAVAGVVLVRQRPSTAGGIVFVTLEDETGISNLVIKPKIYVRYRRIARHAAALIAVGRIERRHDVIHLVVSRLEQIGRRDPDRSSDGDLESRSRDFH